MAQKPTFDVLDNDPQNASNNLVKLPEQVTPVTTNQVTELSSFVRSSPSLTYTFTTTAECSTKLCRSEQGKKTCLNLNLPAADLLTQMQKLDFYCALADNMATNEIECRKI
ncbi:hypothetical protein V1512DRAFT_265454 [Lipomyces arxii]|uniref:uncharacterized protein n=1 Tax=Lipomyces arxii TaxID=56418 RepID=UPI0034CFC29A